MRCSAPQPRRHSRSPARGQLEQERAAVLGVRPTPHVAARLEPAHDIRGCGQGQAELLGELGESASRCVTPIRLSTA